MGKLMNNLQKQLNTKRKEDAENCILLYNYLEERDKGCVWESDWNSLVQVNFIGRYPSAICQYKPNDIGYALLKSLKSEL